MITSLARAQSVATLMSRATKLTPVAYLFHQMERGGWGLIALGVGSFSDYGNVFAAIDEELKNVGCEADFMSLPTVDGARYRTAVCVSTPDCLDATKLWASRLTAETTIMGAAYLTAQTDAWLAEAMALLPQYAAMRGVRPLTAYALAHDVNVMEATSSACVMAWVTGAPRSGTRLLDKAPVNPLLRVGELGGFHFSMFGDAGVIKAPGQHLLVISRERIHPTKMIRGTNLWNRATACLNAAAYTALDYKRY